MSVKPFNAGWGWAGLAVYVLGYDTWAILTKRETLTAVFKRAAHHPIRRWPVLVACSITVLHLYDRLPKQLDPFNHYSWVIRKKLDAASRKP